MILLDTCTLLWLSEDPPQLPVSVQEFIRRTGSGQRYISAITAFEIGLKCHRGKLILPEKPQLWFNKTIARRGLCVLPVTDEIAFKAAELPDIHKDPADRILVATAQEHNLVLITPDEFIHQYPDLKVKW